ncbi:MAG: sigma-E factor negative regulatory protein [Gammaproteobacteria bacterium]|nr:sigma-E factor negative regulatory protein [Gammaproteobacteria bacterium]
MTEHLHESLSALMDNESDELELRRLLKEMDALDPETDLSVLKAKWHRYHVLSASLKQEIHSVPSRNLLAGIQNELEQDAIPQQQKQIGASIGKLIKERKLFQVVGQGAIAASVALAVMFTADLAMVADNGSASSGSAEIADNSTDQFPSLTGELNPDTQTRFAIQTGLDEEEMDRLERVVSAELEDSLDTLETPATFIPEESR